jgi:hypothetical protein
MLQASSDIHKLQNPSFHSYLGLPTCLCPFGILLYANFTYVTYSTNTSVGIFAAPVEVRNQHLHNASHDRDTLSQLAVLLSVSDKFSPRAVLLSVSDTFSQLTVLLSVSDTLSPRAVLLSVSDTFSQLAVLLSVSDTFSQLAVLLSVSDTFSQLAVLLSADTSNPTLSVSGRTHTYK